MLAVFPSWRVFSTLVVPLRPSSAGPAMWDVNYSTRRVFTALVVPSRPSSAGPVEWDLFGNFSSSRVFAALGVPVRPSSADPVEWDAWLLLWIAQLLISGTAWMEAHDMAGYVCCFLYVSALLCFIGALGVAWFPSARGLRHRFRRTSRSFAVPFRVRQKRRMWRRIMAHKRRARQLSCRLKPKRWAWAARRVGLRRCSKPGSRLLLLECRGKVSTGLPAIVQCRPQRRLRNRGGGLQSVSRAVHPAKAFVCRPHVLDRTAVTAIAKMLSARGVESFHRRSNSCVAKLPVYSGLVPGASGFATGEGEAGAGHAKVSQGHAEFKGDEAQEGEQCICEPMWASPRQLVCADFVTDQVLPASTSGCGEGQAPDWRDADVTSVCLRRQGSAYTLSDSPCRAPRGGARDDQSFLHALQHLLATHGQHGPQQSTHRLNPGGSAKGKSKQSGRQGTGKGGKNPAKERQAPSDASDADLLAALTRLVHRASVNGATGLRARLECLVMHAGEGKTLRSNRAERRRRAREKKRQTF